MKISIILFSQIDCPGKIFYFFTQFTVASNVGFGIVFIQYLGEIMGKPAARLTDFTICPMVTPGTPPVPHLGGPIIGPCSPNVIIGGLPAARVTDKAQCVGPTDMIITGSMTVHINGLFAARLGDSTVHGGKVGPPCCPTVLIGDQGGAGIPAADLGGEGIGSPNAQAKVLASAADNGVTFCEACNR